MSESLPQYPLTCRSCKELLGYLSGTEIKTTVGRYPDGSLVTAYRVDKTRTFWITCTNCANAEQFGVMRSQVTLTGVPNGTTLDVTVTESKPE